MATPHDTTPAGRTERGAALRARRERLGMTRAQLAALVGCGLTQLGNIESGAVPRRSAVLDLAEGVLDRHEQSGGEVTP
ncbi:MAG: helix-turn-helix transcriptional regulator [Patulibacter sp.]